MVSDLILGVSVVLGSAAPDTCPSLDVNGNGTVAVEELVAAVNDALQGCPGEGAHTPTASVTPSQSQSPTPTVTATPPIGPRIVFFGVASADDTLQDPTASTPDGAPIYQRGFGFGFRLVVEVVRGSGGFPLGRESFLDGDAPDLQMQVTRRLGNGSADVCDNAVPNLGGVPAVDPPRFDASPAVVDALNDLGCRFVDGMGLTTSRACGASCIRDGNSDYACFRRETEAQFCALIDTPLEFQAGDTLVTARVRDQAGNLGPPAHLTLRIQ